MATLSGKWKWNENIDFSTLNSRITWFRFDGYPTEYEVNEDGVLTKYSKASSIIITPSLNIDIAAGIMYGTDWVYLAESSTATIYKNGWNPEYQFPDNPHIQISGGRIIDFGDAPMTPSDEHYNWFTQNAQPYSEADPDIFIKTSTLQGMVDSLRVLTGKTDKIPITKEAFATEIDAVYQKGIETGGESSGGVFSMSTKARLKEA